MKINNLVYLFIALQLSCTSNKLVTHSIDFTISDEEFEWTDEKLDQQRKLDKTIKKLWDTRYPYDKNSIVDSHRSESDVYSSFLEFRSTTDSNLVLFESSKEGFIRSLIYLAQHGYVDVEEFLLDGFEKSIEKTLKQFPDGNAILSYQYYQDFNRLPPSKRKLELLISLIGKDQSCNMTASTTGDFRTYQYLLLNFEFDSVEDIAYKYGFNLEENWEKSQYIIKYPEKCSYWKFRVNRDFPIFLRRYNGRDLQLRTREDWKNFHVPFFSGVTIE